MTVKSVEGSFTLRDGGAVSGSKKKVLRALVAAQEQQVLVRLRRVGALSDVGGYVIAVGRRWVLLARVADTIYSDGWTAVGA